jgi:hypothetical protein
LLLPEIGLTVNGYPFFIRLGQEAVPEIFTSIASIRTLIEGRISRIQIYKGNGCGEVLLYEEIGITFNF